MDKANEENKELLWWVSDDHHREAIYIAWKAVGSPRPEPWTVASKLPPYEWFRDIQKIVQAYGMEALTIYEDTLRELQVDGTGKGEVPGGYIF